MTRCTDCRHYGYLSETCRNPEFVAGVRQPAVTSVLVHGPAKSLDVMTARRHGGVEQCRGFVQASRWWKFWHGPPGPPCKGH